MKLVELVKIETEQVAVHSYQDSVPIDRLTNDCAHVSDSFEFIPDMIKREDVEINKVVVDGVESYFSVEKEVWEKLCLFENPVTVDSLIKERDKYEALSDGRLHLYRREHKRYKDFSSFCYKASVWQRIKWVFAGFSYNQ